MDSQEISKKSSKSNSARVQKRMKWWKENKSKQEALASENDHRDNNIDIQNSKEIKNNNDNNNPNNTESLGRSLEVVKKAKILKVEDTNEIKVEEDLTPIEDNTDNITETKKNKKKKKRQKISDDDTSKSDVISINPTTTNIDDNAKENSPNSNLESQTDINHTNTTSTTPNNNKKTKSNTTNPDNNNTTTPTTPNNNTKNPTNNNNNTTQRKKKQKLSKQQYVLFVGKLPKEATKEDVLKHFEKCGGVKEVRMLTDKATGVSRKCAYVEFTGKEAHMAGLKLHNSTLMSSKINVEFTSRGRNTFHRMERLKQKNKMSASRFRGACDFRKKKE